MRFTSSKSKERSLVGEELMLGGAVGAGGAELDSSTHTEDSVRSMIFDPKSWVGRTWTGMRVSGGRGKVGDQ